MSSRDSLVLSKVAETRFSNVDKVSRSGENPVRLCNYTDVYNNDYINADMDFMEASATISEVNRFGLQVGDILLTKDSESPSDIGVPALVDSTADDLVCGYHLALIRPDLNIVDPAYLCKQIGYHRIAEYFGQQANGSTRYGLSTMSIDRTPLELPCLKEQVAIGRILRLLDECIQKSEAVINKLKRVREGMLHDLLTRGLDEEGRLRDPVAHPEQFKNSDLGRIPKEWEVVTLSSLCEHIGSGLTPRGGQDVYTDKGVMFIRSQNVIFDGLLLDDVAYIPDNIHIGMKRSEVYPHDVLYNITGASIGRCCVMPEGLGCANVNQHVCILRIPKACQSDAVFLATFLASNAGQKQLEAYNTCGNRQGLNYQQLGSFQVPWPSENERAQIAEQITDTRFMLESGLFENEKLKLLKSGLMEDLLSGERRVPDDILPEIELRRMGGRSSC